MSIRQPITVEQRNAEITRRWQRIQLSAELRRRRRKGTRPSIATLRVCELNRLFHTRYGPQLPDDDAGQGDVVIMINHLIVLADGKLRARDWCSRHAPWFAIEAPGLLDKLITHPRRWRADTLGKLLNLTSVDRAQAENSHHRRRRRHQGDARREARARTIAYPNGSSVALPARSRRLSSLAGGGRGWRLVSAAPPTIDE